MNNGEQLAAWLEELGLAKHLSEARLPSFTRDEAGRAQWTDPGTGAPLTDEQFADLDRVLHSDGDDPEHAVPIDLLLLARQARIRATLLASPWFTYATLAAVRGATVEGSRFAVHKAAATHRLLVVPVEEESGRSVVPAFQLTDDGELRPDLAPVLEPLLAAGMDPWRIWSWLTQPAALTFGLAPERAAADPEQADLVVHAAVRLAERARG